MVLIPQPEPVTLPEIQAWYQLKADIRRMQASEILMRQRIFKGLVPNPVEGTNTVPLEDGFGSELKAVHVINRTVDKAALSALEEQMREAGIVVEHIIEHKPELRVGNYKKLTDEQKHLVDQALVVKPGTPQLDVVVPKKPKE